MPGFRILVVAHGPLAAAFVASAEMICGPLDRVRAIGLEPEDSPESFADRMLAAVDDRSDPVLILTDLVGGTPHNVACASARRLPNSVCVSGANLAVVIEAATAVDSLDDDSIDRLVETGREGLSDMTRRLAGRAT